jgi:hypothetical protein
MENFNPKAPDDRPEAEEQIDFQNSASPQSKKGAPHHHH